MKKLVLTSVCALAVSGMALAQGYVNWAIPTSDVTFETNSTMYSPLFGGGSAVGGAIGLTGTAASGFDYALLYQSTPSGVLSSDTAVWDGTWTGAAGLGGVDMTGVNTTGLSHGGVTAGTVNGASGSGVQVNWANGVTNSVVLVGWSADLGTTWAGVSNILAALSHGNNAPLLTQLAGQTQAFFGETTIGNVNPAASSPGNTLFATSSTALATGTPIFSLLTPMYLLPVPEPATMALVGLGGLSLMLFRRQRK